ncbi:hypothetical protein ZIOFF_040181 [Zingiber officinale]|uniref:Bidirectional sugar transporter SWEET n=1 Tax=Zingiber officinale TaxID=94328 RepID=A0A8J5GEZ8_ZINOF|nr:hypothetical protein ZIOFF_040181 [Zingiber officinale]
MTMNQDTIRNIVGIFGNIISCGLFLSPLPTFIQIIKTKAVEQFSPIPYLATLLQCMLWLFYGLPFVHPNSLLIVTINGIGLVFETTYLSIFFAYATREGRVIESAQDIGNRDSLHASGGIAGAPINPHDNQEVVHCGHSLYYLWNLHTKSVEYMPFTLSFVSFINAVCWTTYGLLPFDINVPNGLGVILAFAQLVLYACYYKSTPKKENNAEIELSV